MSKWKAHFSSWQLNYEHLVEFFPICKSKNSKVFLDTVVVDRGLALTMCTMCGIFTIRDKPFWVRNEILKVDLANVFVPWNCFGIQDYMRWGIFSKYDNKYDENDILRNKSRHKRTKWSVKLCSAQIWFGLVWLNGKCGWKFNNFRFPWKCAVMC